jgi:alkylhydroperoxidase/carboxymuconolactone decarboxylase family protein YurZ
VTTHQAVKDNLVSLAQGNAPMLKTLAEMTVNTFERSGLDEQTYALVRLSALIAMDAAPVSYLLNLGAADEIGISLDKIQGTLVAVAPVVGSARVASAASKMIRALGLAESMEQGSE